jgi:hypothetical protein
MIVFAGPQKMEILELKDIEKEFLLVDARLQLFKHDTTNSVGSGESTLEMHTAAS